MSIDKFTHAEEFYYDHDSDYHSTVATILKKRNLPVRRASFQDVFASGMDGYLNMMGRHIGSKRRRSFA